VEAIAISGHDGTLPKWNGHLKNRYDTLTLSFLQPEILFGDSGNLAGCRQCPARGLSSRRDVTSPPGPTRAPRR
jgi:hypothetical protein